MTAGRRDKLVFLQRATIEENGYGEAIETWGTMSQEWAEIFYGRGDERRGAAATQASQIATFRLLANTVTRALARTDRIIAEGMVWDISGKATPKRGEVEVTATANASAVVPIIDIIGFQPAAGDGLSVVGTELRLDIEELPRV